eukprot:CAMPEP_0169291190 /NCGR_PEP_ID=MMETSP1016-20121227/62102_1 /TAXON_ID=342587 /ORGANISM="Karlodinium micrum, Strain CCMP2283" /LENGTH=524 /DNA_ID=CAMNT_0009381753 /DNA_START=38 /DNA_END=1612 /DNA_ORIENTATION=-
MASMEKAVPFAMQQPPMVSFVPCRSKPPAASLDPRHLAERGQSLSAIDLRPWLEAARNFEMNSDFEVPADSSGDSYNLDALMSSMKAHSDGKWTIQALADKIMLSRMLDNLGVPQMPALLIVEDQNVDARDVEKFVLNHLCGPNAYDVVVKPTHLSNATGVINVSRPTPSEGPGMTIDYLTWHLGHFMKEKAASCESAALQSIRPGFIVQPKYESVVDFKAPLEMRVVVLWGKARLAVWWWGHASRNAWLVRCPLQKGVLGSSDGWQVLHRHQGSNAGFEKALDLFERHITAMADLAEAIAASVGAPFLRSDFFVGCPTWGVRLNEVAYGSGIEYMNRSDDPACLMVDDSVAISQILREGMAQCQRRLPAQHFLQKLGVRGHSYFDMSVVPIPPNMQSSLPARALSSSGQSILANVRNTRGLVQDSVGCMRQDQDAVTSTVHSTIGTQTIWRSIEYSDIAWRCGTDSCAKCRIADTARAVPCSLQHATPDWSWTFQTSRAAGAYTADTNAASYLQHSVFDWVRQ